MKRLLAFCVLCTGLLGLAGCNQPPNNPAARSPTKNSADRQQVMKPVMEESTNQSNNESVTPDETSAVDGESEEAKP
ncbi:hypothetical protein [Rubripirellula reticaptiva]|uniref:Uncharacterized protein n=1 Tax=Rubripirellula reticaptiva TaxID=2528013 RepID=A0A5C6EDE9_9BACT|nr:hypothetical protein [Rubripirellula reticaptiva]TWU46660.1 hypothetical protein Poly59_56330 [Rubripirellula reticaptiva]